MSINKPTRTVEIQRLPTEAYTLADTYAPTRLPVTAVTTLIPDAYTSPAFFQLEQEKVFSNNWVAVGCLSDVRAPGDVFVTSVAGQSVIIIRNKQNQLRAFYNVCRHRGTRLLPDGSDKVSSARIRCPYHSWAYDLDGSFIGTPLFEESDIPPDLNCTL